MAGEPSIWVAGAFQVRVAIKFGLPAVFARSFPVIFDWSKQATWLLLLCPAVLPAPVPPPLQAARTRIRAGVNNIEWIFFGIITLQGGQNRIFFGWDAL